jgi:hypothetical protein
LSTQTTARGSDRKRNRLDLSFLDLETTSQLPTQSRFCIYESQFSLLICGTDHTRWTAYVFADSHQDVDPGGTECDDDDDVAVGPIANDKERQAINADCPIWDPREYYLRILDLRIKRVLDEWTLIIQKLKSAIETQVSTPCFSCIHFHFTVHNIN